MANIKFEGELSNISEKQLELISEVLVKKGFDGAKVTIKVLGAAGDNYMAAARRIIAEKDGKVFKIVAKIASRIPKRRESQNIKVAFTNEDIMYNILSKLSQLEESADVPENEKFKYPQYYGAIMEDMEEIILLEDMSDYGFTMLDRFTSLTDDSVRLVLQNLARFHASSYVLKQKEPETFDDLKLKLYDIWDNDNLVNLMKPFMEATERDVISILDKDKYKKAVKGSMSKIDEHYRKQLKFDKHSRFSVILHGDSWTNNILFRLEEGAITDCCMIDYQLSRVGSPVGDITYLIYNCTDYETRKAHFYDWIDFYHSELDRSLFFHGLRANFVYPRDQLDADLKRHTKVAFATSIILYTFTVREGADAEKFTNAMQDENVNNNENVETLNISNLKASSLKLFKDKTIGLVDSFYDFGYFNA